jgi:hypothetical protein
VDVVCQHAEAGAHAGDLALVRDPHLKVPSLDPPVVPCRNDLRKKRHSAQAGVGLFSSCRWCTCLCTPVCRG